MLHIITCFVDKEYIIFERLIWPFATASKIIAIKPRHIARLVCIVVIVPRIILSKKIAWITSVFEKAVADAKDFKENSFIRSSVNIICKIPAAVTQKR